MGLLDWLTDGTLTGTDMSGSGNGSAAAQDNPMLPQTSPPPTPPPSPPPAPAPDPTPAAGPPDPPIDPSTSDMGGGMQGAGPGAPPQIPLPAARPPGADVAPPQVPTPTPAASAPPTAPGAPMSLAPPAPGPSATPFQLGDQTALGRALGINPKSQSFADITGGIGAGLTAAGNSKGKSAGQAFAAGAGGALEGANKEQHAQEKDANAYLAQAIAAQKAGDTATYQTNYTKYLAAKLQSEQTAAANKDAAVANKNDSPTQLYLSAQREVAADPLVKGALNAYQNAIKTGNGPADPEVQKAKAAYEQTVQERQAAHLAGVGLHPQTAAQIAQQPGMSQANPLDAAKAGITPQNIGQKLQPGQYYKNPTDGKIYQFKGSPTKSKSKSSSDTPAVNAPAPPDPLKPNAVPGSEIEDND